MAPGENNDIAACISNPTKWNFLCILPIWKFCIGALRSHAGTFHVHIYKMRVEPSPLWLLTSPYALYLHFLDVLLHDGVISKKQISSPVHVTKDELIRVHTEEYIEKFFEGKTSAKEQRVTGFTWSEGLVSRCRYETGKMILSWIPATYMYAIWDKIKGQQVSKVLFHTQRLSFI